MADKMTPEQALERLCASPYLIDFDIEAIAVLRDAVKDSARYQRIKAQSTVESDWGKYQGVMHNLYSIHDAEGKGLDAVLDAAIEASNDP